MEINSDHTVIIAALILMLAFCGEPDFMDTVVHEKPFHARINGLVTQIALLKIQNNMLLECKENKQLTNKGGNNE